MNVVANVLVADAVDELARGLAEVPEHKKTTRQAVSELTRELCRGTCARAEKEEEEEEKGGRGEGSKEGQEKSARRVGDLKKGQN